MGFVLSFDDAGVANFTATGDVALEEAIDAVSELYRDPRFRIPSRVFWDLMAGRFSWTSVEVQSFGDFVRLNRPKGPGRAAVLVGDELSFGLSRMYSMNTDDSPVEVRSFRDRTSAIEWLTD